MAVWSFPVCMTYAALRDMFSFTIPNWIPLVLICGYFIATIAQDNFWTYETLSNTSTSVSVLIVAAILFYLGLLGGGDAKLLAAASIWMGWTALVPFLLFISLSGGFLALVWLLAKRLVGSKVLPSRAKRYFNSNHGVPYGIAIAIGSLIVFFTRDWVQIGFLNISNPESSL